MITAFGIKKSNYISHFKHLSKSELFTGPNLILNNYFCFYLLGIIIILVMTPDPALFFLLKNLFMILEDSHRIGLLYFEYNNLRLNFRN
jgi:hypothetical protein